MLAQADSLLRCWWEPTVDQDWITEDIDEDTVERKFWKQMAVIPPMYGADTPGSFMDDEVRFSLSLCPLCCLL